MIDTGTHQLDRGRQHFADTHLKNSTNWWPRDAGGPREKDVFMGPSRRRAGGAPPPSTRRKSVLPGAAALDQWAGRPSRREPSPSRQGLRTNPSLTSRDIRTSPEMTHAFARLSTVNGQTRPEASEAQRRAASEDPPLRGGHGGGPSRGEEGQWYQRSSSSNPGARHHHHDVVWRPKEDSEDDRRRRLRRHKSDGGGSSTRTGDSPRSEGSGQSSASSYWSSTLRPGSKGRPAGQAWGGFTDPRVLYHGNVVPWG